MKYLRAYLRDRRRLLLAVLATAAAAAVLFYLYGLPAGPLLYTYLVCAVICVCFFALPGFVSWARRVKTLERMKTDLLSTLEAPELTGPAPERELLECVEALCGKVRALEADSAVKRRDMLEYYTLWVHQIKTPLSAMGLILQSSRGEDAEALRQELFKVERYVEMVLGYLRMETMTSDLRLEQCDVHRAVSQSVKKFAPLFIYKRLTLDLQEFNNRVVTDEKWLLFVIEQILSNAVKYTERGGVSVSMDENDVLYIRDTGVGISPEDLPRVFERGFTGVNGRLDKTASGLGLYLTKQILDRLGTRIEITSAPGRGTEVRLYLHRDGIYE